MRQERRTAPRAEAALPLEIGSEENVFEGCTRDISTAGAYLMLDRFIPLNTKLNVTMLLPGAPRGGKAAAKKVSCHGIVVRNEAPERVDEHTRYAMAIFFTDLTNGDKRKLAGYVKQRL